DAEGESNTATFLMVGLTVAMYDRYEGAVADAGVDVATGFLPRVALPPPPPQPASAIADATRHAERPAKRRRTRGRLPARSGEEMTRSRVRGAGRRSRIDRRSGDDAEPCPGGGTAEQNRPSDRLPRVAR